MLQQDRQTVEKNIREILADQFNQNADEYKLDSRLLEDIGADSLDMVELAMEIEDEFELEDVTDLDVQSWLTGTDIVVYVLKRMKEG